MTTSLSTIVPFDPEHLILRLREAAERLGTLPVEEREMEHLVHVVTRCSAILGNVYTDERLQAILVEDPRRLTRLVTAPWSPLVQRDAIPQALALIRRLPGEVREVGDQALFDIAISGLGQVRGIALEDLGPKAYRLAADVLESLAADARLREHFQAGQSLGPTGNIEDEVGFLRRCCDRFSLYARMLRAAGDLGAADRHAAESSARVVVAAPPALHTSTAVVPAGERALQPLAPPPLRERESGPEPLPVSRLFGATGSTDRAPIFAAYERLLLFASLDLEAMRRELEAAVVDQPEAVATLVDDFALFAVGTQHLTRPASYFFVGPTGVGKNYLVESLCRVFERQWGAEVPMLVIEGPNYTYASDINELRGATRGFIRSDESGLLTDFHRKAKDAPVSVILVDEVEKAHPQLRRFFLSILDRGTTTDAHGAELCFAGTLIFFTSNVGYRERRANQGPIGFGGEAEAEAAYGAELSQALKRALSPEFINRVKLVRFRHLPRESARRILDLEFARIADRYRDVHGIDVTLTAAGRECLLDEGYSHEYGARHLAAVLQRTCNVEIGKMIRRDESREPRDPKALLALLRDFRAGQQPLALDELEKRILDEARARVPYTRIVVDARDGRIVYRTEAS